jgi:hypothetical protein
MFHWQDCLFGSNANYGVEKLKFFLYKHNVDRFVAWHIINYIVVGKTSEGRDKKNVKSLNFVIYKNEWDDKVFET